MRLSDSALVTSDATFASAPRRTSAYAAIAVGVAALVIGAVAFAADAPATGSDNPTGSTAAASEAAAAADTATRDATASHETADAATANGGHAAPTADQSHAADAKGKKHNGKDHNKAGTTADEVVVEGKQPEQQQVCHKSQATGTRLRQTVCTTVAQQQANDKAGEQQAQDYLRRMSQQGTLAAPPSSPYVQSGIPH